MLTTPPSAELLLGGTLASGETLSKGVDGPFSVTKEVEGGMKCVDERTFLRGTGEQEMSQP